MPPIILVSIALNFYFLSLLLNTHMFMQLENERFNTLISKINTYNFSFNLYALLHVLKKKLLQHIDYDRLTTHQFPYENLYKTASRITIATKYASVLQHFLITNICMHVYVVEFN